MAKKVYTLKVDEKNLETSVKAKAVEQKKTAAESAVEAYGIAQINNASASKKLKNSKDKGFEKVVSGSAKKSIKTELSQVDDYFDFSFKKTAKESVDSADDILELVREIFGTLVEESTQEAKVEEVKAQAEKKVAKTVKATKKAPAKKVATKKSVKEDNKTSTILKVDVENIEEIRNCQVQAEVCAYDDDAIYNIDIARIGSLFDCEKTMLN